MKKKIKAKVKRKLTTRQKALLIAELALEKKAEDIAILDMRKIANFCDFFIIASGLVGRHVKAIAEGITEGLSKKGEKLFSMEGAKEAQWILLDFSDCIVHVFDKESRNFYDLEHLWQDAKRVPFKKK